LQGSLVIASFFSRRRTRRATLLWATLVVLALPVGPSLAQTAEPAPPKLGDSTATRIESMEEQLRGLKATVGALESLLRSKPGVTLPQEEVQAPRAVAGPEGPSEIDSRIEALETQVSALTSQIEQMTKQLTALQARPQAAAPEQLPPSEALRPLREDEPPPPSAPALATSGGERDAAKSILPEKADDADEEPAKLPPDEAPEAPMQNANAEPASLASFPPADAASLYNQGYGDLLRRDYDSAEIAFRRLIEGHPNDKLAGDAQYWLGESYYVRGQFKNAADAFLKGYKSYGASPKAPDSLLKLGMSLAALGQKEAACSSFAELGTKFPSAPSHVREEAVAERRKAGC
jgi:tol-pal system protein YbgF